MKKILVILLVLTVALFFLGCPTTPPGFEIQTEATGNGTITLDPDQETYEEGTEVTVTATPDQGWVFDSWSGSVSGSENPTTLTVDSDEFVGATFVEATGVSVTMTADYADPGTLPTTALWNLVWSTEDNLIAYNSYSNGSAWGPTYSTTDATIDWNALVIYDPGVLNDGSTETVMLDAGTYDWGCVIDADGDGDYEAGTNYVITWGANQPAFADRKEFVDGDTVTYVYDGAAAAGDNVIEVTVNGDIVYNVAQ
jgi:hypothetical protein